MATESKDKPVVRTIKGVQIFKSGLHRDSQGREKEWSKQDIGNILSSFNSGIPSSVPVKLGHTSPEHNAAVAEGLGLPTEILGGEEKTGRGSATLGKVTALYEEGDLLVADLEVPDKIAGLVTDGMFTNVSSEILDDYQGNGPALSGLALLGAERPAVKDLETLAGVSVLDEGITPDHTYVFEFKERDKKKKKRKKKEEGSSVGSLVGNAALVAVSRGKLGRGRFEEMVADDIHSFAVGAGIRMIRTVGRSAKKLRKKKDWRTTGTGTHPIKGPTIKSRASALKGKASAKKSKITANVGEMRRQRMLKKKQIYAPVKGPTLKARAGTLKSKVTSKIPKRTAAATTATPLPKVVGGREAHLRKKRLKSRGYFAERIHEFARGKALSKAAKLLRKKKRKANITASGKSSKSSMLNWATTKRVRASAAYSEFASAENQNNARRVLRMSLGVSEPSEFLVDRLANLMEYREWIESKGDTLEGVIKEDVLNQITTEITSLIDGSPGRYFSIGDAPSVGGNLEYEVPIDITAEKDGEVIKKSTVVQHRVAPSSDQAKSAAWQFIRSVLNTYGGVIGQALGVLTVAAGGIVVSAVVGNPYPRWGSGRGPGSAQDKGEESRRVVGAEPRNITQLLSRIFGTRGGLFQETPKLYESDDIHNYALGTGAAIMSVPIGLKLAAKAAPHVARAIPKSPTFNPITILGGFVIGKKLWDAVIARITPDKGPGIMELKTADNKKVQVWAVDSAGVQQEVNRSMPGWQVVQKGLAAGVAGSAEGLISGVAKTMLSEADSIKTFHEYDVYGSKLEEHGHDELGNAIPPRKKTSPVMKAVKTAGKVAAAVGGVAGSIVLGGLTLGASRAISDKIYTPKQKVVFEWEPRPDEPKVMEGIGGAKYSEIADKVFRNKEAIHAR